MENIRHRKETKLNKLLVLFALTGILLFLLFAETNCCNAMSVKSAMKEYKRFLGYYETLHQDSDFPGKTIYYSFISYPDKRIPYLLIKDETNYSICGIEIHTIKNGAVNRKGQGFSGFEYYHYRNYVFIEEFAGGGCGSITMYKYKKGKLYKVNGCKKYIYLSDNIQVHKECVKFAKKAAKRNGVNFSSFKKIKWKKY